MDLWIDARMLSFGGIGTFLKNLIPFFSPSLILSQPTIHTPSWVARYPSHQSAAPIYSLQEQLFLPKLIPRCDIFWSPHYNIPLLPIRAKKRVVTIHDVYHLAHLDTLSWKESFYARVMLQQAVSRSDQIVTDSQFSLGELHKYLSISEEKIQVIYPGVDFNRFSTPYSEEAKEAFKKKHSLPSSFFLFASSIKAHKNLRLVLDAYRRFPLEIPLVIFGKKEGLLHSDPSIDRIATDPLLKTKAFFLGEVKDEDLPLFYQTATALVFPSLYEGFGLPPLEAMASGCPAIVSRCASMPEICGDAAHYIDPFDAEDLAHAMRDIEKLRKKLIERGKRRAAQFSWSKTAEQYKTTFQKCGNQLAK